MGIQMNGNKKIPQHVRDSICELDSQMQRKWDPRVRTNRLGSGAVRTGSTRGLSYLDPQTHLILTPEPGSFTLPSILEILKLISASEFISSTKNRRHRDSLTVFPSLTWALKLY